MREAVRGLRTVRDFVRWGCTRLAEAQASFGHGTDNAHDEAAWLILWALRLPLDELDAHLDARLLPAERQSIAALIDRRCRERIPTPYLTGEAWLRGLCFRADPRALIPRSLLVEALEGSLEPWLPQEPPKSILDLCTGGASVAIAAALRFPQARVDAADISADALDLASANLALHGLADRITLRRGDLYQAIGRRRYDLVLCNPPYVNAASMAKLPAEFLHEPRSALAGGSDGMDLVRRIVDEAGSHLSARGLLVIEIGHEADHFEAAFPDLSHAYVPVSAGERLVVAIDAASLRARRNR